MSKKVLLELEEQDAKMVSEMLANLPLQGTIKNLPGMISRILAILQQIEAQLNARERVVENDEEPAT